MWAGRAAFSRPCSAPPRARARGRRLAVVHESFGLTPWIREVALGFAGQGYLAVAPDLFAHRLHPGFTPEAAERLMPLVWQMPVVARIVPKDLEAAVRGH